MTPRQNSLTTTLLTGFALGFWILTGCASAGPESNEPPRLLRAYQRVHLLRAGDADTDRLMGFVGAAEVEEGQTRTTLNFVYDSSWNQLGYYLDNGATFRSRKDGSRAEPIGVHTRNRALELLFGVSGVFRFEEGL